ncbi:hypothetical protein EDB92DRAFT_2105615 [Lactarius akahatsu]|uniref:SMC hinge domain-containing protein n=1 Tax=Lactarius akahatsu TaxID=416441 RepID=A0AAD4LEH4_9AGAM|nr:hypothetical protein EDB92DRAFT_2105615 [Lactarius akahatsu]
MFAASVRCFVPADRLVLQDENCRNDALCSIQENTAKTKSEKRKVDQYEEELQWEEKALEGIRDSLEDKTEVFRDRIEQKQKELQPWKTKVDEKQAEVDVKTSERDMLVKTAEALEQASTEAHEALAKVKSIQTVKIGELENLKNRELSLQRVQDLTIRVNQHRTQASSTRQRVEEANASQTASTSVNEVSDSLMRLRDSGRVSGLHGQLRSLGTIPDEYDMAITTNVGCVGFLVLEEIDKTDGMRPIQTPEDVPRLFDLVEPKEPQFAHMFYEALRDTLVAQDLAQANHIAFGARRWRVVTLAEVVELARNSLLMWFHLTCCGSTSRTAKSLPCNSQWPWKSFSAAEAELEAVGESGPQINLEIEKANLDIQDARKRVIEAKKRVHDLRTPSKPDAGDLSHIASLEHEIATAQNKLEGLWSLSGMIEEAIKAIEREILDIGGSLVARAEVKKIIKAEVAMAKAERDLVKFKGSIASNWQSLAGVEIELRKLSESAAGGQRLCGSTFKLKVEAVRAEVENSKADSEGSKAELNGEELARDASRYSLQIARCR